MDQGRELKSSHEKERYTVRASLRPHRVAPYWGLRLLRRDSVLKRSLGVSVHWERSVTLVVSV